jgi:hypothetical protein
LFIVIAGLDPAIQATARPVPWPGCAGQSPGKHGDAHDGTRERVNQLTESKYSHVRRFKQQARKFLA